MWHVILLLVWEFHISLVLNLILISFYLYAVLVFIWYGFYGDFRMVLGPNSSRLMKTTSVFVQQIQVRDDDHRGVFLYAFSHKPQLTFESNWSTSKYFIVGSYSRKVSYSPYKKKKKKLNLLIYHFSICIFQILVFFFSSFLIWYPHSSNISEYWNTLIYYKFIKN